MKRFLQYLLGLLGVTAFTQQANAQCAAGEVEITIQATVDGYGYELYWQVVPGGNNCGVSPYVISGNTTNMDCNYAGGSKASWNAGWDQSYAGSLETVGCFTDGTILTIHGIDEWGDGGHSFDVMSDGTSIGTYNFDGNLDANEIIDNGAAYLVNFTVTAPPANDLALDAVYSLTYYKQNGFVYADNPSIADNIPMSQAAAYPLIFGGAITNKGVADQPNTVFGVNITGAISYTFEDTSAAYGPLLPAGVSDTIIHLDEVNSLYEIFYPSVKGSYNVDYYVTSDNTDSNPADNTASDSFEVTDTIYSQTANTIDLGSTTDWMTGWSTPPADSSYTVYMGYPIQADDTLTSVSIYFTSGQGNNGQTPALGNLFDVYIMSWYNLKDTLVSLTGLQCSVLDGYQTVMMPQNTILKADSGTYYAMVRVTNNNLWIPEGTDPANGYDGMLDLDPSFIGPYTRKVYNWGTNWAVDMNFGVAPKSCTLMTTGVKGNATSNGASNGYASVDVTGGQGTITYMWSNGATTSNITGLAANVYSVTVTDDVVAGCTSVEMFTITEPAPLTCDITVTATGGDVTTNGGNDGYASADVTGAQGALAYMWSNSATTQLTMGLTAGVYTVTVSDDAVNNCAKTASVTITEPAPLTCMLSVTANGGPATTAGGSQGYAYATPAGNQGMLTYEWSNGSSTQSINGLMAGTYNVTVTDDVVASCSATATFDVIENLTVTCAIGASIDSYTNVSTNGGSDGAATVTAFGGIGNVTYMWSNGATDAAITGLMASAYTVTVSDDNAAGCTVTSSVEITEPAAAMCNLNVVMTQTNANSNGAANGDATANIFGGQGTITYMWSNAQTTSMATGLMAGTYTVTVTDDIVGSCSMVKSVTITEPAGFACNLQASVSKTNVSTNGGNDGAISVSTLGGQGTISYSWSHNGALTASSATGLTAGAYTVTVTDNITAGCSVVKTTTLTEPVAVSCTLDASASKTNVTTNGGNDGTATVTALNGQGTITYAWSNAGATSAISGLTAGTYSVTVTDDITAGCTVTKSVVITQPAAISCTVAVTAIVTGVDLATATVSGQQGSVSYAWSNGQNTAVASGLSVGSYTVTVTDNITAGCTATATVVLTGIEELTAVNYSIYPNPTSGNLTVNFVNAASDEYRIRVMNVVGQEILTERVVFGGNYVKTLDLSGVETGVYFVTISSSKGTSTDRIIVK